MNKDLASIITPCYNGEKYIGETIETVIRQSYNNWEMIIVDDGSKDESATVIKKYAERDPRIKYIKQENAGSAAARNNGIRRANGRYIALLDADDIWHSDFLEQQIAFMKEKQGICVACSYNHIDEKSQPILGTTKVKTIITEKDMKVMNRIGCLTGLYDCSKYGKIYLKEELKSLRDDYAYWYDIVSLEGIAYGNPKVLADYRVLKNSTTANKRKLIRIQYKFYREYLKENAVTSWINILRWGICGLIKFSGN